jgi:phenylacetate-CoA ligase
MLRRELFLLVHEFGDPSFYSMYRYLLQNQWKPYPELLAQQEAALRAMIRFSWEQVPYYRRLFRQLNLDPTDIRTVQDLRKLPVLTKDTIRQHWGEFTPANLASQKYHDDVTSGTSGTPFPFRLSTHVRFLGAALGYRGWGYAGYEPGDSMVHLWGQVEKSPLRRALLQISRNIRQISVMEMDDRHMEEIVQTLNATRPAFIRAIPSGIYFLACWMSLHGKSVPPARAIFTTTEKLYPQERARVEEVFGARIYDGYGLYDGGLSAFECPEHAGLHVDTERSILEVVDSGGNPQETGCGRILATSLHNHALPFLRYETGDMGEISDETCACGRGARLLTEVMGRSFDYVVTPEGKYVAAGYFMMFFWKTWKEIREYQIVQDRPETLVCNLVVEEHVSRKDLEALEQQIRDHAHQASDQWNVEIRYLDSIDRTKTGKFRFVINRMKPPPATAGT